MFSKNIKLVTIIMIVFIMSSVALFAECDMFAMISQKDHYISWKNSNTGSYNDPYDYFNWLRTPFYKFRFKAKSRWIRISLFP